MPAHIWLFYAVVLSQVFLVSFVFPRQLLSRVRSVVETYPPSTYPKLYPVPVEDVEKAQRTYKHLNTFALLAGLILVSTSVYTRRIEMLNWDSQAVLFLYTVLQLSPHVFAARRVGKYFKRMRQVNPRTTRNAELHPRRVFDFISPTMVGMAIFTYVAFIALVLYIRRDPFSGFAGYWNIALITALNLLFAGIVFRTLYGKKVDPHRTYVDRLREMQLNVKIMAFASIAGTLSIALGLVLPAFDLRHLTDIFSSLYIQVLIVLLVRVFRTDDMNYEVYKEDPVVA